MAQFCSDRFRSEARPIIGRFPKISFRIKDSEKGVASTQRETAISDARSVDETRGGRRNPRRANVVITFGAPVPQCIRKHKCVQLVNQNVLIISKTFIEPVAQEQYRI